MVEDILQKILQSAIQEIMSAGRTKGGYSQLVSKRRFAYAFRCVGRYLVKTD